MIVWTHSPEHTTRWKERIESLDNKVARLEHHFVTLDKQLGPSRPGVSRNWRRVAYALNTTPDGGISTHRNG